MIELRKRLLDMDACDPAVAWVGDKDLDTAWRECHRGDWMLWLWGRCEHDRTSLVLCACECARLALKFVAKGEERPLKAIEAAEAWTRGEVDFEQVQDAASSANAADAADAASAAAHAAHAVSAAANAAHAAGYAAYAAFAADAADAARLETLAQCADIVRRHMPKPPQIGGEG